MAKIPLYTEWIEPEGLIKLEGWAREGLTTLEIAKRAGVAIQTLNNWMVRFPEVKEAIKQGKEVIDLRVEKCFLQLCLGYEITDYVIDSNGNKKAVKKQIPPDREACKWWLKNRMSDKWKEKTEMDITGGVPIVIKDDLVE